jgi:hypothetical protein
MWDSTTSTVKMQVWTGKDCSKSIPPIIDSWGLGNKLNSYFLILDRL